MYFSLRERKRIAPLISRISQTVYRGNDKLFVVQIQRSANSLRFHVTCDNPSDPGVLIKITRTPSTQGHLGPGIASLPSVSRRLQEEFRAQVPAWLHIPEVYYSSDDERAIVMKYVNGTNFKSLLTRPKSLPGLDHGWVAGQAGRALARWHLFGQTRSGFRTGDPSHVESIGVLSYLDFSTWNVRVGSNMKSIALLDFPGVEIVAARERDLATFLHSLLVVRHHPLSKIKQLTWWDWREAFAAFLDGYASESGIGPTGVDLNLVVEYLRASIRMESEHYRRHRIHPRLALEGFWYSRLEAHPALSVETLQEVLVGKHWTAREHRAEDS